MIILAFLFYFSLYCLIHSYLLYPLIVKVAASGRKHNENVYNLIDETLPQVSILLSAYNEEAVISEKLESIFKTNYPKEKLQLYIGSDCSDDRTHELIDDYVEKYPTQIHFYPFSERSGKPVVINKLVEELAKKTAISPQHILIITDANVMFTAQTIFELVKHFKNPEISLVDSNIQHPPKSIGQGGIAQNESSYISREVGIKHDEGRAWGSMIGPLGGCYAFRSSHFQEVPSGFLVDDFYIAMKVFEKGGKAINEPLALCYEDVSSSIAVEFRRKTRISTGNFANLAVFWRFLLPQHGWLAFAFWSHKVLRWLGPFYMAIALITNGLLAFLNGGNLFYQILFLIQICGYIGVPLLDFLLRQVGIRISILRYITYFIAMNLALAKGFFNYIKGVRNNVWQPTKRNIG